MMAGGGFKHIAMAFGWSLRYAHQVIEDYVALAPDVADEVGRPWRAERNMIRTC
jgi:hypothetical protein